MPTQSPTERELLIDVQLGNIQDARNKLGEIVVKINELKKGYKGLSDQQKQSEVTTGEYTKSINLLNTDKASLLKTIRELTIAQRQETLNLKAADDSIIGMRGSLAALKDQYIRLGKAAREGIGGTDLLAKISKLNAEVSKAEQSMGVFSRNVGNYKSGFNGLSNSINQVAREMPNFAQSATIGFMALSNNLPILADEIQRVRQANALLVADGKPTVSVFKQIATAVFSWQSALITAISLSVIYAKEIQAFITGVETLTEAQKESKKQQEENILSVNKNINAYKVFKGELSESEAAYSDLMDEMSSGLTDIQKASAEKIASINGFFNTLFTNIMGGFGAVRGETIRYIDEAKERARAAAEEQILINKFINEANGKALDIANDYRQKVRELRNEQIADELQREIAKLNEQRRVAKENVTLEFTDTAIANDAKAEIDKAFNIQIELATKKHNDKLDKEAKDRAKKKSDDAKKQAEDDAKFLAGEFDRAIEYSKEHYTDLESLVKQSYANGQLTKEQYEDELLKLERERMVDSIRLHKEYNKDLTKVSAEAAAIEVGAIGKPQTGGKIDLVKPKGTFSPDISKQLKDKEDADKKIKDQEDKNRKLAIDAAINAAKETVDAVAQIKQQELDRQLKRELTAIQRNADKEDRILENRLKNGIISEGQYNDAKQKLNDETAAKELEANRKMFEEKKRLDTATAIANGALAITSILAQYPKFDYGIAAAIAIGAAVATTATQVAVIQAQKFALGGKVNGKSHAEGGVMIEAEGGEGMINKNSMRSTQVMQAIGTPSQIASAINMSGGGISWETGATLNSPNRNMFNSRSENSTITYSQMAALLNNHANSINSKKVVILESEITKTQNKVKAYETSGRF